MVQKLINLSIGVIMAALAAIPLAGRSQDTVVTQHTQQVVRTAFHGKAFPQLVSLEGGAVPPADAFRECDPGELAIVHTAGDLIAKLVQAEQGGRKWIAGNTLTSVNEAQYGFTATVLPSPNGSYIVRLELVNSPPEMFMTSLSAFADCLNISIGSEDRATQLGLLPLPAMSTTMAQYAPTLGFYMIRLPFRR